MDGMSDRTTLGEFLRLRRGRLTPEDVGIASHGARRVPGLRREELAQLAGVSVTYYTRLEQGQSHQASEAVIESLARALVLTDDERAYLHNLAKPAPSRPRTAAPPATARHGTRQLLNSLNVPAVVTGMRTEVLAWNQLGHRLLAGHLAPEAPDHPEHRPNLTRMLFLDPHHRDLYPHWHNSAICAVGSLRLTVSRHRDDRDLTELIGELIMNSAEFATLWTDHPVADHASGPRRLRHPEVGELTLELETLLLADEPDHRLLMYSAANASPSHDALRLLGI